MVGAIMLALTTNAPVIAQSKPANATEIAAPQDPDAIVRLMTDVPDAASVAMPPLDFVATPTIEEDYDKYYYFGRADTSFPVALADLRECDGFARGLTTTVGFASPMPYPMTTAGILGAGIGGAIGNAMAAAIFGSAEKRKTRRTTMRRCMHYKGYQRFGIEKGLWRAFNFEEGLSSVQEIDRQRMLAQQAKVASTFVAARKDLGL
jgi:hypothetical protein